MLHMFSTQLYAFDKVDNTFGTWQGRRTGHSVVGLTKGACTMSARRNANGKAGKAQLYVFHVQVHVQQ